MEIKKRDFIIKYFGCHTTIDDNQVLTSLANASLVPKTQRNRNTAEPTLLCIYEKVVKCLRGS